MDVIYSEVAMILADGTHDPQQNTSKVMSELFAKLEGFSATALGYPMATEYDYSPLYPFLKMSVNNCGDPYRSSNYRVQTHEIEREVVGFMSELFRAPPNDSWGYVTNGGTEGNLYGLYLARQTYPDAVTYYSDAAHYSIKKNLKILRMPAVVVGTDETDAMDLEEFAAKLVPDRPAIITASIGTTMRQGRDDIKEIRRILREKGVDRFYIHCDAALDGMLAPFLRPRPAFDFQDGADSIAVSGHKFIGCPIPCGVVICRKHKVDAISEFIPYIGGYDETIPGSRNGITPLFLWYGLKNLGFGGLAQKVNAAVERARYAQKQMRKRGIDARLNPNTITVVFPRPSDQIVRKWQLATQGDVAHILTVPGIREQTIDTFVAALAEDLETPFKVQ